MFTIGFDLEEHGLARLTLRSPAATMVERVSYIGQGLTELAKAVLDIAAAEVGTSSRVIWATEPSPAWIMSLTTDRASGPHPEVTVRVVETYGLGSTRKTDGGRVVGCPPDAVVLAAVIDQEALVRSAVQVLADNSGDGGRRYEQVWRQRFPHDELAALRGLMARRGWLEGPDPRPPAGRQESVLAAPPVSPPDAAPQADRGAVPDGVHDALCGWGATESTVVATYFTSGGRPVALRCGNIYSWGYKFVNANRADGWDDRFDSHVSNAIENGQQIADGSRITFRDSETVVEFATTPMADGQPKGILTAYLIVAP